MSDKSAQNGPDLAVVDYGMGNLHSVVRAWEHVGGRPRLVDDPQDIGTPDALVFPGQGAIKDTMVLLQRKGFDAVIKDWVAADRPFFGICLGQQALFEHSEEGDTDGLGIFPGEVVRFRFLATEAEDRPKVPHMGWNNVTWRRRTPVDATLDVTSEQFYFVHSYYVAAGTENADLIWGETIYGGQRFVSAIQRGKCYATQFHPEKSQARGLTLYRNFVESL